jgi:hypothetical protein
MVDVRRAAFELPPRGLILHDEGAVSAPPAHPDGLDNGDGVPERAVISDRQPQEQGRVADPEPLVYRNPK